MPERSATQFAEGWIKMLVDADFDRLPEFLAPDCVHEYPQSGERFRGIANIRAVFENYPGGFQRNQQMVDTLKVSGENDRWALAPNFTLLRMTGSGGSYTTAVRGRYPDGSEWYIVTMFELADGLMTRAALFFAPLFEAPDWRRPYAEPSGPS
jgi:ketosteroid isomerase-like protein